MNTKYKRLRTKFGPETRFEVRPGPPAPFGARLEPEFERLKLELLAERLEQIPDAEANSEVRRAANEAEALAWVTRYPLLLFPVLFQEKARAALARVERQAQIRRVSRELLAV